MPGGGGGGYCGRQQVFLVAYTSIFMALAYAINYTFIMYVTPQSPIKMLVQGLHPQTSLHKSWFTVKQVKACP